MASPNSCHSNCEVGDIWRTGARCVDDLCEYPPHSARRPLRQRDRHAETRGRQGGAAQRHLDRRADPVLLRHGYHRSELERSGVPPLKTGDELCLSMAPKQLLVKGDDRICSRLLGVLNQLSTPTRSPRQDRVIEALDQRRQHHRWFDGASSEYGE